jgi:hypothetical protein
MSLPHHERGSENPETEAPKTGNENTSRFPVSFPLGVFLSFPLLPRGKEVETFWFPVSFPGNSDPFPPYMNRDGNQGARRSLFAGLFPGFGLHLWICETS